MSLLEILLIWLLAHYINYLCYIIGYRMNSIAYYNMEKFINIIIGLWILNKLL